MPLSLCLIHSRCTSLHPIPGTCCVPSSQCFHECSLSFLGCSSSSPHMVHPFRPPGYLAWQSPHSLRLVLSQDLANRGSRIKFRFGHLFAYCLWLPLCYNSRVGHCVWVVATETIQATKGNYAPSGPCQDQFAWPSLSPSILFTAPTRIWIEESICFLVFCFSPNSNISANEGKGLICLHLGAFLSS